jgi:PAS domain S-box-containing protein
VSDSERHNRAREQTIGLMVESVRSGDYVDALHWLNTLAAVDLQFSLTADEILTAWRQRARRHRNGHADGRDASAHTAPADYRGLFAALLQYSRDGIVISDADGGWMLECSASFAELTGYPREELLGRTSLELGLVDPEVRREALDATRRSGAAGGFVSDLRRKDGEVRRVEFSPQLLAGEELLLTIVRDITDRRA